MLSKLVEEFEKEYPNWNSLNSVNYNLSQVMMKWQDPKTADSILKGEFRQNLPVLIFFQFKMSLMRQSKLCLKPSRKSSIAVKNLTIWSHAQTNFQNSLRHDSWNYFSLTVKFMGIFRTFFSKNSRSTAFLPETIFLNRIKAFYKTAKKTNSWCCTISQRSNFK